MSTDTKETLDVFEGFDSASDIDFFGEKPVEENSAEAVMKELEKEDEDIQTEDKDDNKEENKSGEEENTQPDIKFFEDDLDEDEEEQSSSESDNDNDEPESKVLSPKSILTKLQEKGLAEFELEEGEELTDELADEIIEDSYESAVEKRVGELFNDIPQSVKDIVKYAMDGGNVDELFSKMKSQPAVKVTKDMDLENEENQMTIIRLQKQAEGEDSETTESYIEFLKDSGKLKGVSEKFHSKMIEAKESLARKEAERQAKVKEQNKKNERLFRKELTDFVNETDEINGVPLNKEDKKNLPSYMSEKIKLEDGRVTTQMHFDLYNALQDKEKSALLAKILKSDFDFSDIAKAEKTKYAKEVKGDLNRSKKQTPQKRSAKKKKDLASYFND